MRRPIHGFVAAAAVTALALCAALGVSGAARAQKQPAASPAATSPATVVPATPALPRLVFAGAPLTFPADAAPFRDPFDGALCVTPETLAPLGAAYVVDEKMGKVAFALPEGGATVTVDLRKAPEGSGASGKAVFVPVVEVIEGLGGKCEWDAATGTLFAHSVLTGVDLIGGQLRIKASLPVKATVTRDNGGRLLIVDLPGAQVGSLPKVLPLTAPNLKQARTGQFRGDTARVVLEFTRATPTNFAPLSDQPAALLVLNPAPLKPEERVAAATPPAVAPAPAKPAARPAPPAGQPTVISGVTFRRVSDTRAQFVISAGRSPATQAEMAHGKLVLSLLNATLGAEAGASLAKAEHPLLRAAQVVAAGNSSARLVLDLTRVVSYGVMLGKDGTIVLDIGLPRGAGGRLSGKLVCVDAGHGAQDHGAPGVNGSKEKNVNLGIATQLADVLRDAGANVMMIRTGDSFLPVNERPRVANRAGADFFISVHSDSTDGSRAVNGSTIYYHGYDPYCRALARCIADRFDNMGGIRTKGIKSDFSLYSSGLGVLRGARMVAVLVECGYMTNPNDVRLLNDGGFQRKIAEAIAGGLKDYIEGNPDVDTRNVNPNVPAPPPVGDIMGSSLPPAMPAMPAGLEDPQPIEAPEMPGAGMAR